ncbi:2-(5''-triphosphoribosyl)-3'-dephosphocoenzyme-A synthase [Frankliniella fusca]|uniref:2-(5''-triphosphoribosyl)-3'-dephosphocoenzyme-A synthase n=1 Tax=Frankliniella fusca TaxID=407009 RepID=A0AAE1L6T6_9NEOP|nr:2-(5''-triphosphoribosyl)-3'-dephosphocoenzyme-A synthase [Frankliniella fusca]
MFVPNLSQLVPNPPQFIPNLIPSQTCSACPQNPSFASWIRPEPVLCILNSSRACPVCPGSVQNLSFVSWIRPEPVLCVLDSSRTRPMRPGFVENLSFVFRARPEPVLCVLDSSTTRSLSPELVQSLSSVSWIRPEPVLCVLNPSKNKLYVGRLYNSVLRFVSPKVRTLLAKPIHPLRHCGICVHWWEEFIVYLQFSVRNGELFVMLHHIVDLLMKCEFYSANIYILDSVLFTTFRT